MISEGTTFRDYESFIAYMEKEVTYEPTRKNGWFITSEQNAVTPQNYAMENAAPQDIGDIICVIDEGSYAYGSDKDRGIYCTM